MNTFIRHKAVKNREYVKKKHRRAKRTQASKTMHGLDGQHQAVDRTPRGRVNQNDRGRR